MSPRFTITSAVVSLAAAAACTSPSEGHDPSFGLTEREVSAASLAPEDLPGGGWHRASAPDRGSATMMESSSDSASACSRATAGLAAQVARWRSAEIDATDAYARTTHSGEELLKEEIVVDPYLESSDLAGLLRRQASACRNVVVVLDGETVESSLRVCKVVRGGPGIQIVQAWSTSSGTSGSTRFAYLFRGHLLTVVSLVSSTGADHCEDAALDAIVAAAAEKIDRLV